MVIDARGRIVFINPGFSAFIGWKPEDIQGRNISLLMADDAASRHDEYLERYIEQATAEPGKWPASTVVGTGRDVCMKLRDGSFARVWLTVHSLEAPSKVASECHFVGSVAYMQGNASALTLRQATLLQSSRSLTPSSTYSRGSSSVSRSSFGFSATRIQQGPRLDPGTRRNGSGNKSINMTRPLNTKGPRLTGVQKKSTVILFDVHSLPGYSEEALAHEYQNFLTLLNNTCSRTTAQIHGPLGDRVLVTLSLSASSTSQRSVAGHLMFTVMQGYNIRANSHVPVYAAACITDSFVGAFAKHTVLAGEGMDLCVAMLQVAAETKVRHPVIDASLYEELQFTYECRQINLLTLHPKQKRTRTFPVYEMAAMKDLNEEEWMYQVEARHRSNPWEAWVECWRHLQQTEPRLPGQLTVDVAAEKTAARECLDRHIERHDNDPVAVWLEKILRQTDTVGATETAGKLRYVAQYALPSPAEATVRRVTSVTTPLLTPLTKAD